MKYIAFVSGGNDSIALLQYLYNNDIKDVTAIYNDTGWAIDWWKGRVAAMKDLCHNYNFKFVTVKSEGMEALVKRKKGWPMAASAMQFCTQFLKTIPSEKWLAEHDPLENVTCVIGLRKQESKNRADTPEYRRDKYGERLCWYPIRDYKEEERDELIKQAGLHVLTCSSMECFPCVCSNRSDFRRLAKYPERIEYIAQIEKDMGFTKNNKPRTMFRPYRHMGAVGIKEVVKWGLAERGKYRKGD